MAICSRNICVFIIIIIVVLYMHVHDNTKLKCTKWTDITLCNLKFVPIYLQSFGGELVCIHLCAYENRKY